MSIKFTYSSGYVENKNSVQIIGQINIDSETMPVLFYWIKGDNIITRFEMQWTPTKITRTNNPVSIYMLNKNGTVGHGTAGIYKEEFINKKTVGTLAHEPLLDIRTIGKTVFAAGMSRQVYMREKSGIWRRIDSEIIKEPDDPTPYGFTSIDGISEDFIIAVGYFGEIFSCRRFKWIQHESPTNVLLHKIRVLSETLAYASGQKGILLHWDGRIWSEKAIAEGGPNLWDLEWFDGQVYVTSENTLYRLVENQLVPVEVPGVSSFGHLHANDGVLWSFGTNDLAWTSDGVHWEIATPSTCE